MTAAPEVGFGAAQTDPAAIDLTGAPALVVFVDEGELKCLRFLRRGFRHCFVAVQSLHGWVICDPLSHRTDLCAVGLFSAEELARWYRDLGLLVVETRVREAPFRPAPVSPFTCVEAVKRVLGIHAPWTLTPWQLYRLLCRSHPGGESLLTSGL